MLPKDLVFNELSLATPSGDKNSARLIMDDFIATLRACRDAGVGATFRTPAGFSSLNLANAYPIAQWRNDPMVSREKRIFIGLLSTKSPFFDGLLGSPAADRFDHCEFFMNRERSNGLGVAYLLDAISISAPTGAVWDNEKIALTFRKLDESTAEIVDTQVEVRHVSRPTHVEGHLRQLNGERSAAINSGLDLWNARSQLFDRLEFCDSVKTQVQALTMGSGGLPIVSRTLTEMQNYCETWTEGPFDKNTVPNTTLESESTLQQFGDERTFLTPDRELVLFSWHVKRGSLRIYFIPDAAAKTCLIGPTKIPTLVQNLPKNNH